MGLMELTLNYVVSSEGRNMQGKRSIIIGRGRRIVLDGKEYRDCRRKR